MVQEKAVTKRGPVDIAEVSAALGGQALAVSPQYIESTVRSLALLRELVHEVLVEGRDYGSVPGLPEFLWDPGASTIIASFNCHAGQRRILSLVDDGKRLSVVLEVPIIHNVAQVEVGSGIGAATVAETKYKYRWERNPEDWGYNEEQIEKLETRERYDHIEYKILNPEPADLLNTVIKMGSKRAEVDGAEALPGVASALKELLEPKLKKGYKPSNANRPTGEVSDESPRWTAFWTQAKALVGIEAEKQNIELSVFVHQMLGVASMKDWLKSGRSLDDAIRALAEKLGQPSPRGEAEKETALEDKSQTETAPSQKGKKDTKGPRAPPAPELELPKNPTFKSWSEVAEAALELGVYPSDVFRRSGYSGWSAFPSFRDAWTIVEEIVIERKQKPQMM